MADSSAQTARRTRALLLIVLATLTGCAARVRQPPDAGRAEAASATINSATLAAPIRFLADDLFEGRGPGTRGDALARAYVATEMEEIGLQPGAADGSWEQPVELIGLTAEIPASWDFRRAGQRLRLERNDFVATAAVADERVRIENAEVVFVGYGIEAPEYQWDDFKGADVRGKVLLMLNDDPDWDPALFAGKRRLYYGRWTYKYESAARHGAVGAIIIHTPQSAAYPWQTVQTSWSGENSRLPQRAPSALQIQAWVTEPAAEHLAALAGRSLASLVSAARSRAFTPVPLDVRTSLTVRSAMRPYATANVIGVLPGTDPALRDQAVIYTAHHDHLGTKIDANGQPAIYNGALDNAAGVAQLLAIARAFVAAPPPRRSVIFLAVAAEEQGLLGSEYYVKHPTVPPARMVAAINFDGGNI